MSMAGYTKLFNSILASTIWREDDKTRLVWITLLAMADKKGIAEGSIPGLADLARVEIPECEEALRKLMSPDPYSRTTEYEGRRIEKVEGGWAVLNHAKYRAKMSADERREYNRLKQKEWRQKHSSTPRQETSITVNDCNSQSALSAHTEAAPKAKSKEGSKKAALSTAEFLTRLKDNPIYLGIDVEREFGKAKVWCETRNRDLTQRFFVNWLNKADKPLLMQNGNHAVKKGPNI